MHPLLRHAPFLSSSPFLGGESELSPILAHPGVGESVLGGLLVGGRTYLQLVGVVVGVGAGLLPASSSSTSLNHNCFLLLLLLANNSSFSPFSCPLVSNSIQWGSSVCQLPLLVAEVAAEAEVEVGAGAPRPNLNPVLALPIARIFEMSGSVGD